MDRARSYQENGGMVNYLDVLMGSTSFSDFIDRANAVATIVVARWEGGLDLARARAVLNGEIVPVTGLDNEPTVDQDVNALPVPVPATRSAVA